MGRSARRNRASRRLLVVMAAVVAVGGGTYWWKHRATPVVSVAQDTKAGATGTVAPAKVSGAKPVALMASDASTPPAPPAASASVNASITPPSTVVRVTSKPAVVAT